MGLEHTFVSSVTSIYFVNFLGLIETGLTARCAWSHKSCFCAWFISVLVSRLLNLSLPRLQMLSRLKKGRVRRNLIIGSGKEDGILLSQGTHETRLLFDFILGMARSA